VIEKWMNHNKGARATHNKLESSILSTKKKRRNPRAIACEVIRETPNKWHDHYQWFMSLILHTGEESDADQHEDLRDDKRLNTQRKSMASSIAAVVRAGRNVAATLKSPNNILSVVWSFDLL
jgi:hypothetical protein